MNGDGLVGTVEYASGWLVLALGLVAVVLVWNVGLLVWGRPVLVRDPDPVVVDPTEVRRRYVALLDELAAAHASGRTTSRDAHRELSALTRRFVEERTGLPATRMTLAQLSAAGVPDVVAVVGLVYPPAFRPGDEAADETWDEALARARAMVDASWS